MCIYIYIYIYTHTYIYIYRERERCVCIHCGFQRVGLEHNLNLKGWNFKAHREFPGKFESSNVSRDNVSREIGRTRQKFIHIRQ